MKKLTALLTAVVMCLTLTACKEKDQDVFNTEVMIRAIETVTDQSGDRITTAEKFYNKLSDEQRRQVSNYDTLLKAREEYNKLIVYGHWQQFGNDEAYTFTLNEDGTFIISDGRKGSFDVTDNEVVLTVDDTGEVISYQKDMYKNLLHLINDEGDFIRPDLLTTASEVMVLGLWDKYFTADYHVHIDVDEVSGLETGYWNSIILLPKEEFAPYIAPQTDFTVTMTYTTEDMATTYNIAENNLLIVEKLTEPEEQTVKVQFTKESFANTDKCCDKAFELAHGGTKQYKEYKELIKTLEYLDNATITAFDGTLYYYDQLKDYAGR